MENLVFTATERKRREREHKTRQGLFYFTVGFWAPKKHEQKLKDNRPKIIDYIKRMNRGKDG